MSFVLKQSAGQPDPNPAAAAAAENGGISLISGQSYIMTRA
jgi:hypothetical protein